MTPSEVLLPKAEMEKDYLPGNPANFRTCSTREFHSDSGSPITARATVTFSATVRSGELKILKNGSDF